MYLKLVSRAIALVCKRAAGTGPIRASLSLFGLCCTARCHQALSQIEGAGDSRVHKQTILPVSFRALFPFEQRVAPCGNCGKPSFPRASLLKTSRHTAALCMHCFCPD